MADHAARRGACSRAIGGLLVLAAALASPAAATAAETPGSITGRVTTTVRREPIEWTQVCANQQVSATELIVVKCAYTNANGEYTISSLASGDYVVEFNGTVCPGGTSCATEYVTQYWDDKPFTQEAEEVSVTAGPTADVDAELEVGGKVTGTVTSEPTDAPVKGGEVCAYEELSATELPVAKCVITDSSGEYQLGGLAGGTYLVEFNGYVCTGGRGGECVKEYVTQYWQDKAGFREATKVSVSAAATVSGVDATLVVGAQIKGSVTDATSHDAVAKTEVCPYEKISSEDYVPLRCVLTNEAGEYTVGGLAGGEYVVAFNGRLCRVPHGECVKEYVTQYWDARELFREAERVALAVGEAKSGVDAALVVGGRISGTIRSNAIGAEPLEDVYVCALALPKEVELERDCARSNSRGEYLLGGLGTGNYDVDFTGDVCLSAAGDCSEVFVPEFYDAAREGAGSESGALAVAVSEPETTSGIDAVMAERSPRTPLNIFAPLLGGNVAVGSTLTCSAGSWAHRPTKLEYAWLRNGVAIPGQTASSYTIQTADEGGSIACLVTAGNAAGAVGATSAAVAIPATSRPPAASTATTGVTASGHATSTSQTTSAARGGTAVVLGEADAGPRGWVTVRLRCDAAASCAGRLRLVRREALRRATAGRARGKRRRPRVQWRTVLLASGGFLFTGTRDVRVHLTANALAMLQRARGRRLAVQASGQDVRRRGITLRLVRGHRGEKRQAGRRSKRGRSNVPTRRR
jgi:hypothetical protein